MANLLDANTLFLKGIQAFSKAEKQGIRIDVSYCKNVKTEIDKKRKEIEEEIFSKKIGKEWRRLFGSDTTLLSNTQLSKILFEVLGLTPVAYTEKTGEPKVDKESLKDIEHPLVKKILAYRTLNKAANTYFDNILRETNQDGFLRASFNLHTTISYRSSAQNPSVQNLPIRDPIIGKMIRKAFIPRKGHQLVELDYKALEVYICASYHQDQRMIEYLLTNYDMHKQMACLCYTLEENDVNKLIRYCAKNKFVFPVFYGSWWKETSVALWNAIKEMNLNTTSGIPLYQHLANIGITKLGEIKKNEETGYWEPEKGSFREHIASIDNYFWNKLFPEYKKWRKDWHAEYLKKGYFISKTGFLYKGVFSRNEVINLPVQGSAFHCNLYTFIEMTKKLEKSRMESLLIGQVHDSILGDVKTSELPDYLAIANQIGTRDIMRDWDWIKVPLVLEAEASPEGLGWDAKEPIEIPGVA